LRPELKFSQKPKKTGANHNDPRFLASLQSTSKNTCIVQASPPGPAKHVRGIGSEGRDSTAGEITGRLSPDRVAFSFATAHPRPGDTEVLVGKRWNSMEEYPAKLG